MVNTVSTKVCKSLHCETCMRNTTNDGIGSKRLCTKIHAVPNTTGKKMTGLCVDLKDTGVSEDFLMLVIKERADEYLNMCHQMRGLQVWQMSSKFDETHLCSSQISACTVCLIHILFYLKWKSQYIIKEIQCVCFNL